MKTSSAVMAFFLASPCIAMGPGDPVSSVTKDEKQRDDNFPA